MEPFFALQLGFVQASIVRAAKTVLEEFVPLPLVPLPRIITWASKVDMISAQEDIAGNHFAVGGIKRIMIPRQVSSVIADVL